MAWFETGWAGAAGIVVSGLTFNTNVRIVGDVSRSNNTIRFRSTRGQITIHGTGASLNGYNLRQWVEVQRGVLRVNDHHYGSGTKNRGDVYETWWFDADVGVGADTTSMELNSGSAWGSNGVTWAGGLWVSFPAAGSPQGLTRSVSNLAATTATLGASLSNWGDHCTAGNGQRIEYRRGNSGSFTNLAFSTSGSHTRNVTGLTSNQLYQVRSHVHNGAGRTATTSTLDFRTLPLAPAVGSVTPQASSATLATTQNNGGGAYSITKSYRVRKGSEAWGSWENFTGDNLVVSGLLPSTEYSVQVRSTTTAGSTEGSISTFTTLPAAKLIMPDGSTKNAIPRVVMPDGAVSMKKVRIL